MQGRIREKGGGGTNTSFPTPQIRILIPHRRSQDLGKPTRRLHASGPRVMGDKPQLPSHRHTQPGKLPSLSSCSATHDHILQRRPLPRRPSVRQTASPNRLGTPQGSAASRSAVHGHQQGRWHGDGGDHMSGRGGPLGAETPPSKVSANHASACPSAESLPAAGCTGSGKASSHLPEQAGAPQAKRLPLTLNEKSQTQHEADLPYPQPARPHPCARAHPDVPRAERPSRHARDFSAASTESRRLMATTKQDHRLTTSPTSTGIHA